jgi:S-adenosylmethionine synthetase
MEAASVALCQAYIERAGRVLHYNLDKALLVAGQTIPALGGGEVVSPIRLIAGDRATREVEGMIIPVDEIVEATVRQWFSNQLRFVDPVRHVAFESAIKPGSAELVGIFDRKTPVANDTSVAVGYAPLSETERLVLECETYLNSSALKDRFPAAGEDVKVMGVRRGRRLQLTVAVALVDRFISRGRDYFDQKQAIRDELKRHLQARLNHLDGVSLEMNTLDDEARGADGMYLTVLGTSAESGDGGEVGRGNAVNGLISLNRPTSNEAAAGKNATSHVGKIYNLLSFEIAKEITSSVVGVREAYVWLCSQIGRPIAAPWATSVNLVLRDDATLADVRQPISELVQRRLDQVDQFTDRLTRGEIVVC